jgi:hypothetical protein
MGNTQKSLLFFLACAVSGCGYNTKEVASFNESAIGLTKSYSELMESSVKRCRKAVLITQLSNPDYTNYTDVKNTVDGTCATYAKDVKTASASAVVINTYAEALSALVGISPQFLDDDAKNLKDAALTIKKSDGTQRLDTNEVEAFEKLAKLLSEMITTAAIKDKATELMRDNSAAVNRQVDILKNVANHAYKNGGWVANQIDIALQTNLDYVGNVAECRRRAAVDKTIHCLSNEEAIPARYIAFTMAQDNPTEEDIKTALNKFESACEAFKTANNNLESKFSKLSKQEQIKSIKDLKDKIDDLRKSINKIT